MTASLHGLPAVPEDVYLAAGGSLARTGMHHHAASGSRPNSVMNIYGSTGDLYQHLNRAANPGHSGHSGHPVHPGPPGPPLFQHPPVMRHPSSSTMSFISGQPHLLERTSSVSSALDAGSVAIYGTIRRGPPIPYQHPPPQPTSNSAAPSVAAATTSPTSDAIPAGHPLHPHQQIRTPANHPHAQMQPRGIYFVAPPRPNPSAAQEFYHGYPSGSGTIPLPAKRQMPYGVACPVGPAGPVDPRYRQVLPPVTAHVALRPTPLTADPAPARLPVPSPPHKDEREAPEGASSSPGLIHDAVIM